MTAVKSISPQALRQKDLKQALVVDVRTPMEFAEKRLALQATLAPVQTAPGASQAPAATPIPQVTPAPPREPGEYITDPGELEPIDFGD